MFGVLESLDRLWKQYSSLMFHFHFVLCSNVVWKYSHPHFNQFHHILVYVIFFHRKENNNIFVDDLKEEGEKRPIPNPCRTFLEAFEFYPEIMENIDRVGFVKPTPIQVWVSHLYDFMLLFMCLISVLPTIILPESQVTFTLLYFICSTKSQQKSFKVTFTVEQMETCVLLIN